MSGTTRVSRYQKGKTRKVKTYLDLLEQEIVSGSGICWAILQSAPHPGVTISTGGDFSGGETLLRDTGSHLSLGCSFMHCQGGCNGVVEAGGHAPRLQIKPPLPPLHQMIFC